MFRLLVLSAILAVVSQAQGVMILDDPTSTSIRNNGTSDFGGEIGFEFTLPAGSYTVSSLGFWDGPNGGGGSIGDGLDDGVTVRLWDNAGTQLATVRIDANTVGSEYAWGSLSSAVALTGGTYVLSGNVDSGANAFVNQTTLSGIASIGSGFAGRWSSTEGAFPSQVSVSTDFGFIGPNADITAVPEPSALGMICLVGLFAAGRRWKKNITLA